MPTNNLTGEALLNEMERAANDECVVINPTTEDFEITYDRDKYFLIPNKNKDVGYGKGKRVLTRGLAMLYISSMTDHLINQKWEQTVLPEKAKFDKRGEWFGQKEIQIAPRTNDAKLRLEIGKTLWGGVVREFGKDQVQRSEHKTITRRNIEEEIMNTPVETATASLIEDISDEG